jgi:2-polyprenyl-6-methoxyphenol hydroxylase-like FAD-dependent oxidoreductase
MTRQDVPVLVVGGSLVGMFTAALLGRHGIHTLVAERHRSTAIHPRAAFIYQRSMEVIRSFGIEDAVRQKSFQQFEPDGAILSVESIAGPELHRDVPHLNQEVRHLSPSERLFITQDALEPLLKLRAEEHGADLRFGTELVSFEEQTEGVTAELRERDTGRETSVHARYLVAADGAHSQVRKQLGIPLHGRGPLSRSLTIYFKASVGPLFRGRNLSVILVRNETFRGFFRIEKPYESGFLIIHGTGDPEQPNSDCWELSEAECAELLRIGLGADIPATIVSIQKWECSAHTAQKFRQGRVFLAGDSAHVMPPYGGFGGNTGIQDAHNLAWKLALVLNGTAGASLLDTYEAERLPVAELTVEQAYARYVLRGAQHLRARGIAPFASDVNVDLGYCYSSAAVIGEPGTPLHDAPHVLAGRPGARAPHVPIERGGKTGSSIDLFGRGMVLLTGRDAVRWQESGAIVSRELPLEVHRMDGAELRDSSSTFHEAYGISHAGAVLVRPDGVVAWREHGGQHASAEKIREVLRSVLATAPRWGEGGEQGGKGPAATLR